MPPTGLTWEGFWLPNLISWGGQIVLVAGLGTLVTVVVRRLMSNALDRQGQDIKDVREASLSAAGSSGITESVVSEFKDRFDDVYGALLAERLQEAQLRQIQDEQKRIRANQDEILGNQRRVFEFMAELETERHDQDRAVITGSHFLDDQETTHVQHP